MSLGPTRLFFARLCQSRLRIPHFRQFKNSKSQTLGKSLIIVNNAENGEMAVNIRFLIDFLSNVSASAMHGHILSSSTIHGHIFVCVHAISLLWWCFMNLVTFTSLNIIMTVFSSLSTTGSVLTAAVRNIKKQTASKITSFFSFVLTFFALLSFI